MKSRKESVIIELTSSLQLSVEGIFTPRYEGKWTTFGESEPEEPAEFEIEKAEIYKGTFDEFMDWNDEWLYSQIHTARKNMEAGKPLFTQTLFEYLAEKAIETIENE